MLERPIARSSASSNVRRSTLLAVGGALFASLAAVSVGCGDSGSGGTGGSGGSGGSKAAIACPDAPQVAGCTVAIAPSSDDYTAIETALNTEKAGSTICLCPGTFAVSRELDLATEKITIRGAGAAPTDTIVDFATQTMGDKSIAVTAGDFTISNLWVKNSPGDGVDVTGVTGVTFKDMKVSWDAGSVTSNGAYAVYPVKSTNILVDNVEVIGAADAGIYVGQSQNAIVRNSTVHGSVAGIESENTTDMEVYGNDVFDNTAGILIFALPHLEKHDALRTNVHDNHIHENNHENFAAMGSTVSHVPVGTGMLILAADAAEVHKNNIEKQDTVGIVMVSGTTFTAIGGGAWDDPNTDPYPEGNYIHDNTFTNCGANPHDPISAIPPRPLENVLWDGDEKAAGMADFCLGTMNLPTFRNINGLSNLTNVMNQSTDTTPYECDHTPLTPVMF